MSLTLVKRAVQQEVFDCLDHDTLAVGANWHVRLSNAEKMLVKAHVSHSKLKKNRCLSIIEISYQLQVLLKGAELSIVLRRSSLGEDFHLCS